jgi:hypothetical protein
VIKLDFVVGEMFVAMLACVVVAPNNPHFTANGM